MTGFRYELPHIEKALVLAPHPDDEALGMGGTILKLNAAGTSSRVVFLTDGERLYGEPSHDVAEKRRAEGLKASELLGCSEPIFLGLPDGGLADCVKDICERLTAIIVAQKPVFVFAPSPIDYHRDHIATAVAALALLKDPGSFQLAFYEVYSTLRFTHLIEITDVVDRKKETILNYRTGLYGKPHLYVNAALGLNAHRALFTQEEGFYEAFCVVEKAEDAGRLLDHLSYHDLQPGG
ncbi:MAG: PIG-L family deacetylase [Nitrospiraceae bacterium]|nr:PIG-L family deacetylase [Nitrospiraceae bacterium]